MAFYFIGILLCSIVIGNISILQPVSAGYPGYNMATAFTENCDTWDKTKWSYYWNPPTVSAGTWVFNLPAGWKGQQQANFLNFTEYGTYEVRFKTSGPKVAGTRWYVFLYDAPNGDRAIGHDELDLTQVWNSRPTVSEYSISYWVNGKTSSMGIGYWYINVLAKYGINFEDGNYHIFKYAYSTNDLIIYVDNVQIFKWSVDCKNTTALGLPVPPMQLMIGAKGEGTSTSSWSLTVDYIKYYA